MKRGMLLRFILLGLMITIRANADYWIIGTGGSNNLPDFPITSNFNTCFSQMLVLNSQLPARSFTINGLAYQFVSDLDGGFATFTVYMGLTASGALTATPISDLSLVATVSNFPTTAPAGWKEVTFDTPFTYDGSSNLVIQVCQSDSSDDSGMTFWAGSLQAVNSRFATNTVSTCPPATQSLKIWRPNIRLNTDLVIGDNCELPVALDVPYCVSDTTTPYADDFYCDVLGFGRDKVYQFTLATGTTVRIFGEADFNADWALSTVCDASTADIFCIDYLGTPPKPPCSEIASPNQLGDLDWTGFLAAGTYYLWVDGHDTEDFGSFAFAIGAPNTYCEAVTPTVLTPGVRVTFTGDNTLAAVTCPLNTAYPYVWIAFSTSNTMNITLDHCSTTPAFTSAYRKLAIGCPCSDFTVNGELNGAACGDNNLTIDWACLPAGTYYYPVICGPGSTGAYTINVVANFPSSYCDSYPLYPDGSLISNVSVNTINNTSGTTPCTGYTDFTAFSTDLEQGMTYTVSITGNSCSTYNYTKWAKVFIDYDNDFCFDAGEQVFSSFVAHPAGTIVSGLFTVPSTAILGPKLMRVVLRQGTEEDYTRVCGSYGYGETEDYTVNIVPPPGITFTLTMDAPDGVGTVFPAQGTHVCVENTVVNLIATPGFGYSFSHWTGNVADEYQASTTITMDNDYTIKAFFVPVPLHSLPYSENFTGLATGQISSLWDRSHTNWGALPENNAGGVSPEMLLNWQPTGTAVFRLNSWALDASGASWLEVEFKHFLDHFTGAYMLGVQTSQDGSDWTDRWTQASTGGDIGPETIIVNLDDVAGTTFYLAFVFDGYSYNIDGWHIDDICVREVIATPSPESTDTPIHSTETPTPQPTDSPVPPTETPGSPTVTPTTPLIIPATGPNAVGLLLLAIGALMTVVRHRK